MSTRGWPAGTAFEESVLRLLRRLKEGVEERLRPTGLEVTAFADWNPGPGISIERAAEYAVERRARDEAAELTAEAGFLHQRARQLQNTVLPAVGVASCSSQ